MSSRYFSSVVAPFKFDHNITINDVTEKRETSKAEHTKKPDPFISPALILALKTAKEDTKRRVKLLGGTQTREAKSAGNTTLTNGTKRKREEEADNYTKPYTFDGDGKGDVERLTKAARRRYDAEKTWEKRVDRIHGMLAKQKRRV